MRSRSRSIVEKVEFDQRMRVGVGRAQPHAAARERPQQAGRQVADLPAEFVPRRLALHVDVEVGGRAAGQRRRKTKRAGDMRVERARLARRALQMKADEQDRVVLQVGAHARPVGDDVDAERAQFVRRADAAAQQDRRRMNAAAADDHLARVERALGAVDPRRHAGRARAVEIDPAHARRCRDRQVGAPSHVRRQVGHRARHAVLRRVGHRHRAETVAEIRVHVGDVRDAIRLRVVAERARQRRPQLARQPAKRHRPGIAVHFARAEIPVVFELAVIRQHAFPVPAGRARGGPLGVIGGRAAQSHHAHQRSAAADHVALRKAGRRAGLRRPPVRGEAGPGVRLVVIRRRIVVADVGGLRARLEIAPRLDEQHGVGGFFGQTRRHHAAGDAGADDDVIKTAGHFFKLPRMR